MSATPPQVPSAGFVTAKPPLLELDSAAPDSGRAALRPTRVLLVGHHAADNAFLRGVLTGPQFVVRAAPTLADAIHALRLQAFSVAICESDLPDGAWRDFLNVVACIDRPPEVVVASRLADASLWAEALNLGAWDVLSKPFSPKETLHVVACACERWVGRQTSGRRRAS